MPLLRGMICLSLAIGFEEDRARLGLAAAVERLRDALPLSCRYARLGPVLPSH